MNAIAKAWRNFRIRVANRRHGIAENKFKIGDWVVLRNQQVRDQQLDSNAGEVVDAFYGFDMIAGWRWHYKVSYKKRDTVIVLYDEQEICLHYTTSEKTPISMTFGRRNISDRLNRTGELLPREVFCIMVDFTSDTGGEGTHYFYETDRDNNIWELLLNIVLISTRDKRLNEIGI